MSTSGLDPNVPLPPVDEDSDLVGEKNKRGIPENDPNGGRQKAAGLTLPLSAGGAYVVGPSYADQYEEAAGDDEDSPS
jgi:hypothetical protein